MIAALTSLEAVYVMSGALLLVFAGFTFADRANPRRVGSGRSVASFLTWV